MAQWELSYHRWLTCEMVLNTLQFHHRSRYSSSRHLLEGNERGCPHKTLHTSFIRGGPRQLATEENQTAVQAYPGVMLQGRTASPTGAGNTSSESRNNSVEWGGHTASLPQEHSTRFINNVSSSSLPGADQQLPEACKDTQGTRNSGYFIHLLKWRWCYRYDKTKPISSFQWSLYCNYVSTGKMSWPRNMENVLNSNPPTHRAYCAVRL